MIERKSGWRRHAKRIAGEDAVYRRLRDGRFCVVALHEGAIMAAGVDGTLWGARRDLARKLYAQKGVPADA